MLKWGIISFGVLLGFGVILLLLGVLLHDNKERVTSIKRDVEQQKIEKRHDQATKIMASNTELPPSKVPIETSLNKQIIIQHLTCVSNEQCVVADAVFSNLTCQVAINKIGAVRLAKVVEDNTVIDQCTVNKTNISAICVNNLCTLE